MRLQKGIFIVALMGILSFITGSWIYHPLGVAVEKTNLVLSAHVFTFKTINNSKYACAEPLNILFGDWNIDSTLYLPILEQPDTGIIISASYEILYDSNTTYLLLLRRKGNSVSLADYPWISQFRLDSSNTNLVDDIQELLRIKDIPDTVEKALAYQTVLTSPYAKVRESAVWELSQLKCEEALHALLVAVRDTTEMVTTLALSGLCQLGREGVTSPKVAASLESLLVFQLHSYNLYRAYAAQNGEKAIPLLRRHHYLRDPLAGIIDAHMLLLDTTATNFFREIISFPEPSSHSLRQYALSWFLMPDSITIPFPDSVVISWAMSALSDTNESIQNTAIQILEKKTGLSFGSTRGGPEERAKQRAKIIKKWRKWYKEWLQERKTNP